MSAGPAVPFLKAPFGQPDTNGMINFAGVTDGLSGTVFLAEILKGTEADVRGTVWTSVPGGGIYMTRFTPNSSTTLRLTSGADVLPAGVCSPEPNKGLACANVSTDLRDAFAGKSRHPGGINALFGDGSVRFPAQHDRPEGLGEPELDQRRRNGEWRGLGPGIGPTRSSCPAARRPSRPRSPGVPDIGDPRASGGRR